MNKFDKAFLICLFIGVALFAFFALYPFRMREYNRVSSAHFSIATAV